MRDKTVQHITFGLEAKRRSSVLSITSHVVDIIIIDTDYNQTLAAVNDTAKLKILTIRKNKSNRQHNPRIYLSLDE